MQSATKKGKTLKMLFLKFFEKRDWSLGKIEFLKISEKEKFAVE